MRVLLIVMVLGSLLITFAVWWNKPRYKIRDPRSSDRLGSYTGIHAHGVDDESITRIGVISGPLDGPMHVYLQLYDVRDGTCDALTYCVVHLSANESEEAKPTIEAHLAVGRRRLETTARCSQLVCVGIDAKNFEVGVSPRNEQVADSFPIRKSKSFRGKLSLNRHHIVYVGGDKPFTGSHPMTVEEFAAINNSGRYFVVTCKLGEGSFTDSPDQPPQEAPW